MDKTAWEYLKEDIMETIDQYLGADLTKQSVDLSAIKDLKVATNDAIRHLIGPELQKLMDVQDNGITILYLSVSHNPKQVELCVDFTHEESLTRAKFIFHYECVFGDIIRMLMRL